MNCPVTAALLRKSILTWQNECSIIASTGINTGGVMSTTQFTFIAILLFAVLVLLALLLFQYSKGRAQNVSAERIEDLQDELVCIGEQEIGRAHV